MNKWNLKIIEGMYGPVHTIDDGGKTTFMIRDEAYYPTASMTEEQWKLVSAAPELYEALQVALNGLTWYHDRFPECVDGSDDEAIEQITQALQKASGDFEKEI